MKRDRDDLVVGVTAALLDLYREEFEAGRQSKETTLRRLTIQANALTAKAGEKYLRALIQTLKENRLDAENLFRSRPAGSA